MKIIFLDIDGVLNSYQTQPEPEKGLMFTIHAPLAARLNALVARTGAQVVLSSTWRCDPNWRATMREAGLVEMMDRTPTMRRPSGTSFDYCERGKEIGAWLAEHPDVDGYAIIDDDNDMLPEQQPNYFRTSLFEGGLTEEIAGRVATHLHANSGATA